MELSELVGRVARALELVSVPYFVTGSLATIAFGEPRLTLDIDLVASLKEETLQRFLSFFPEPDFYLSESAARAAVLAKGQFNIIHIPSGLKVDVFIPAPTQFNQSRLSRCRPVPLGDGKPVQVASPEDAIIKKLEYYRQGGSEKHLRDIGGVLKNQGDKIDLVYIEDWVDKLRLTDAWHKAKSY